MIIEINDWTFKIFYRVNFSKIEDRLQDIINQAKLEGYFLHLFKKNKGSSMYLKYFYFTLDQKKHLSQGTKCKIQSTKYTNLSAKNVLFALEEIEKQLKGETNNESGNNNIK